MMGDKIADPFLNIRIFFAPSFLFGSILVAVLFGDPHFLDTIKKADPQKIAVGALLIAGALWPVGFAIGGLTNLILFLLQHWRMDRWEVALPDSAWKELFDRLKVPYRSGRENKMYRFSAAVTFLRQEVDKPIFDLMERRGFASSAYASCVVAIVLSWIIIPYFLNTSLTWKWYSLALPMLVVCSLMTFKTRYESMKVLEFLTQYRNKKSSMTPKPTFVKRQR